MDAFRGSAVAVLDTFAVFLVLFTPENVAFTLVADEKGVESLLQKWP